MSRFQFITLALFIVFIIAGVISFATFKGTLDNNPYQPIIMWGTFPADTFNDYVSKINSSIDTPVSIEYVEKKSSTFSQELLSALARGTGPDVILIPSELMLSHQDKFALIPYDALSRRDFNEMYIDEASIYLNPIGIAGIPFSVDPLVMYWNKDNFASAGLATYPKYWDEFVELNKKLTVKDEQGNIRRSALALGEFSNVVHSREILGALLLQIGNPVTCKNNEDLFVASVKSTYEMADPGPAIDFFTRSIDPADESYSWNKTFSDSKNTFLAGILSVYFGFASELSELKQKNPNLNFDVSMFPQIRNLDNLPNIKKTTYGRLYGFSILKASSNVNNSYQILALLTSPQFMSQLSDSLYLPSVSRSVISEGSDDPYITLFNESALVAKTWIDADPEKSRALWKSMIEEITSGRKSYYEAVKDMSEQYDALLIESTQ